MPELSIIRLTGGMPQRLFIPLKLIYSRGTAQRAYQEASRQKGVAVYWAKRSDTDNGTGQEDGHEFEWERAIGRFDPPKIDFRIPSDIWRRNLSLWEYSLQPENAPKIVNVQDCQCVDICMVVASFDTCGLYVTCNPQPKVGAAIDALIIADSQARTAGASLAGKKALVLTIPKITLIPYDYNKDPKTLPPKPNTLFDTIVGGLMSDPKWEFRPLPLLVQFEPVAKKSSGSAVFLDFGTSATTLAYGNIAGGAGSDRSALSFIRGLTPWTHTVIEPRFDCIRENGQGLPVIEHTVHRYDIPKKLIQLRYPAFPSPVESYRKPITEAQAASALHPSLISAMPPEADEPVTAEPEDAIGEEAEIRLKELLKKASPRELAHFLFSPKRLVGATDTEDLHKDFLQQRKCDPVVLYLRNLFDAAFHSLFACEKPGLHAPVERVCFSYPVTWTAEQRESFRKLLKQGLNDSAFSVLLPSGNIEEVLHADYAMDEASAAFLGYLYDRFGGLDGRDVVTAFGPFLPDPSDRDKPSMPIHALVCDIGGGTTDVVLLKIVDSRPTGTDADSVTSKVLYHYALDSAGLEVTRLIAERIKEHLRKDNNAEELRTNLLDDRIDRVVQQGRSGVTQKEHRRELAIRLYEEADDLKIRMSSGEADVEIPWKKLLANTPLKTPEIHTISRHDLEQIVQSVFEPLLHRIREWMAEGARLDLVIFTGRSASLPGLRKKIFDAIPTAKQPYEIDIVDFDSIAEAESSLMSSPFDHNKEKAKLVVSAGLALNYWNRTGLKKRAMKCEPIDERRRSRAIGVLDVDVANRPIMKFHPEVPLIVVPDNGLIEPDNDLTTAITITKADTRGFYVGIGFTKPGHTGDEPQPMLRAGISVKPGGRNTFESLRFVFRQRSATDVRVSRIECKTVGGEVSSAENLDKRAFFGPLTVGVVEVLVTPYTLVRDFRFTGRIHCDIDRDM